MRHIKKRKKINQEEREYIEYLRNEEGRSIGTIARALKRSKSSISEELRRIKRGAYSAEKAEVNKQYRQYHKSKDWMKIVAHPELQRYVEAHLKMDWSPEEIAGRIEYVDTQLPPISTPSIYKFVYSVHGRPLEKYLRYGKRTGSTAYERKMTIDGRVFIDKRPKKANTRRFFGDWEADFICSGKHGKGYLLVFVERKTRYCVIKRIASKDVATVQKLFEEVLGVQYIVNTLTIDNDIVFRKHAEFSRLIGAPVFFTHPYHSWEKGTVENMNKWIRQYVKKGSDISALTDEYIQMVEDRLNGRPRKCLDFRTPREAIAQEKHIKQEVAVIRSRNTVVRH
jgi:IS30 family transposase